ncbi:hypothetical protein BIT28_25630 [Photobacterium proteolyticum]|uniref:PilZ domain-containing protein n=1 Tax=Photobacterium proteolyticum TaxID=1903952 RepID=A0A1Q9GFL7_9GAMM|nr:hypothetical protein [Photobacterium proteolyticum]OLQ73202.1 hypothetical protein BIT28_25630 [Photobacterium proteolyticum]
MSLVKVHTKALEKMMAPVHHCVQPDIAFSPGLGGLAARLHKSSIHSDISRFDIGSRVTVSRLSKRCLYLQSSKRLELKASYELSLQGFYELTGYLTPVSSSDMNTFQYKFHSNTWLTDEQLMRLVIDYD